MKVIDWKNEIKEEELKEVSDALIDGKLVIFPTETVYGIGAIATSEDSVSKIFLAKGRAQDNPLIVHLSSTKEIEKYAYIENDVEKKLIESFMPGPFTLILKKKDNIPNNVSGGMDTIGIRIPDNKIANRILSYNNIAVAAPSANKSGKPSGTDIKSIYNEFLDSVDYLIDGGNTDIGIESTVVRVIKNIPVILRPGFVTKEDIMNKIGVVQVDDNINKLVTGPVLSPGMKYTHYAPVSKCELIYGEDKKKVIDYFTKQTNDNSVIIGSSLLKNIKCRKYLYYGDSLEEISHNIFRLLREADKYNPSIILIEGVSREGLGLAIMNRLIRASGYNYKIVDKD